MISYASASVEDGHINLEIEMISKYDRTPEDDGNVETIDIDASNMLKCSDIEIQQGDIVSVIMDGKNLLGILKKEDKEKERRAEVIEMLMNQ